MKNKVFYLFLIAVTMVISSCGTTSYYSSASFDDGIYYRATRESRAAMVASNKEMHESAKKPQSYILEDEEGNYYLVDDETSYAERLRKFDSPTYTFYVDYGVWTSPWYNPWWGSYRYPYFGYPYYSWYSGWYSPWYHGWYDPWYSGWYDPWYYGYGGYGWYYNYWNPWYYHGYYPGPGHPHNYYQDVAYGKRSAADGQSYRNTRRTTASGGSAYTRRSEGRSADSYNSSGVYTGARSTTGSRSGTIYQRSSGSSAPVSYTHLDVYKRQHQTGRDPP